MAWVVAAVRTVRDDGRSGAAWVAISRQGLPEHRDALMGIAWGLALNSNAIRARDAELRARGFRPIQARVALARHACRLCWRLLQTQQPFDERRYAHARQRGR